MTFESQEKPVYEYATFPRQFLSYKWYKPILVFALAFVFMTVFQVVIILAAVIWQGDLSLLESMTAGYDGMDAFSGPGAFAEFGSIAVMLPSIALAALIVRDRPYSSYTSSRGGWNWGAFAKCLIVAVVVMGISTFVTAFIPSDAPEPDHVIQFTVVGFIVCTVLLPFQCIAEEYVFRGFFLQTFGSWFKLPVVGVIVSAVVFAAGHPYNDIGVVLIFAGGIIWGVVAWQTKGLEASSAAHIVNNYIAFYSMGFGLQAQTSQVDVVSLVAGIVTDAVFAAAVIYLGKKGHWFSSKGDGTAAFNVRVSARLQAKAARKQAGRGYVPEPPQAACDVANSQAAGASTAPQIAGAPVAPQAAGVPTVPQAVGAPTMPGGGSPSAPQDVCEPSGDGD